MDFVVHIDNELHILNIACARKSFFLREKNTLYRFISIRKSKFCWFAWFYLSFRFNVSATAEEDLFCALPTITICNDVFRDPHVTGSDKLVSLTIKRSRRRDLISPSFPSHAF